MREKPRVAGIVCLLIGIGLSIWLKYAYNSGSTIGQTLVMLTPFLCLHGLVITLQPRLFIPKGEFRSAPPLNKFIYVSIIVVGIGLGVYLRFVVFKDWK